MKIENISKQYILNGASIDEISEKVEQFLGSIRLEKSNIIRIRLSLEEALLRWKDHFGSEKAVQLDLGQHFGRPSIRISLNGEPYDPLMNADNDLGMWANSLLTSAGLDPVYSYQRNVNVVTFRLSRPKADPAKRLLLSVVVGLVLGIVSVNVLPGDTVEYLAETVFDPLENVFFNILNVAAVPIIFLDVLSATCGAGTIAGSGKENRKLIVHFLLITTIVTVVGTAVAVPFMNITFAAAGGEEISLSTIMNGITSLVPKDVMTPFQTGESQQLIFLAIVLGNALLLAGHQASNVTRFIDECHSTILIIADWVSRITPIFVVILLILGVWSGSLQILFGIWKPVLIFTLISLTTLTVFIQILNKKKDVSIATFVSKIQKPFEVAFRNSSVNAAYGLSQKCCTRALGMNAKFVDNIYPFGLVLFMPTATLATMLFTLYAAGLFEIQVTIGWILIAILLAVTMQTASPPVAGVNLLAYAAIFARVGIPENALILAMVADILFCFLSAAIDQTLLQIVMIFQADRTGQLNVDILRKN